jgi:hypothetical protein
MQRFPFASLGSGDPVRPRRGLLSEFPEHTAPHRTHSEKITCPSHQTTQPRLPHLPWIGNRCALTAATALRSAAPPSVSPAQLTSPSTNPQELLARIWRTTFPAPSTTVYARGASGAARSLTASGPARTSPKNLFRGISWRASPDTKKEMFPAFKVVRQLHEMLWYLAEATARTFDPDTSQHLGRLRTSIESAVSGDVHQLLRLDLTDLHAQVRSALMDVSEEVRASYLATGDDHLEAALFPGADLMGKKLRSRSLCGANLRSTYLIAADLRDCDLSGADLLGADFRDARLEGADLSRALFLTQAQLNAAKGGLSTKLPADLSSPTHWHGNS